jgi:hypothetical protein
MGPCITSNSPRNLIGLIQTFGYPRCLSAAQNGARSSAAEYVLALSLTTERPAGCDVPHSGVSLGGFVVHQRMHLRQLSIASYNAMHSTKQRTHVHDNPRRRLWS